VKECVVATASHLDQRKHGLRPTAAVGCGAGDLSHVRERAKACVPVLGFEQHPVKGAVETISPTWSSDTPHGTVAFMSL
jgi:hypothetical protein